MKLCNTAGGSQSQLSCGINAALLATRLAIPVQGSATGALARRRTHDATTGQTLTSQPMKERRRPEPRGELSSRK